MANLGESNLLIYSRCLRNSVLSRIMSPPLEWRERLLFHLTRVLRKTAMLGNAEMMGHGGRGQQTTTLSAVVKASPPLDAPAATPPLFEECSCLFSTDGGFPPNHSNCSREGMGRMASLSETSGRQHLRVARCFQARSEGDSRWGSGRPPAPLVIHTTVREIFSSSARPPLPP